MPLPVASLKNPIHFTLPLVKESQESENLLSPSSSAKTTTSDLSAHLLCTDKEEQPEGSDEEEGSVSSAVITPAPAKNNSTSKKSNSDCSDTTDGTPSTHPPVEHSPDSSSHDISNLEKDRKLSSCAENLDIKIDIDIEAFQKLFPELEESQDSVCKYYSTTKPTAETDKGPNPGKEGSEEVPKYPVVVVPTAVQVNEEECDKSEYTVATLFKTAAYFAEEATPQLLGHTLPMKPEPMYSKGPSVDRLVQ